MAMQKLTKREVELVTKLLRFKIRTESPFDLKRSSDKIKKQMVEFFLDEVFNDIVKQVYPLEMDVDTLNNFIQKLNRSRDFMNMIDVYKGVSEFLPEKKVEEATPSTPTLLE